jgi:hypothetical protein
MSPAIIAIRHACDESGRFQPVEQASERTWPDVENLSEGRLIEPYELCELDEDGVSRPRHAWELGLQFSIVEPAPQPGSFYQELHDCIGLFRIEMIRGRHCRSCDYDLLQQTTDGRFVRVVTHKLLHDRLGQKLIKRRLVERGPNRRCARRRMLVWDRRVPHYTAPRAAGHNSTPLAGLVPRSCDG